MKTFKTFLVLAVMLLAFCSDNGINLGLDSIGTDFSIKYWSDVVYEDTEKNISIEVSFYILQDGYGKVVFTDRIKADNGFEGDFYTFKFLLPDPDKIEEVFKTTDVDANIIWTEWLNLREEFKLILGE